MPNLEEMRAILGHLADGKSEEQILRLKDGLTDIANAMYDHLQNKLRLQPEQHSAEDRAALPDWLETTPEKRQADALDSVRWTAHGFDTGSDGGER